MSDGAAPNLLMLNDRPRLEGAPYRSEIGMFRRPIAARGLRANFKEVVNLSIQYDGRQTIRHMQRGAPVAILRLAKVISQETPLIQSWVDALEKGVEVRPCYDMKMAPSAIEMVAKVIDGLMEDQAPGIFQLTGPRDASYADVGYHLAKLLGADSRLVKPVSAATLNLPTGAAPPHTTLDSSIVTERYGLVVPEAFETVDVLLADKR